jgi:hypothetical protein
MTTTDDWNAFWNGVSGEDWLAAKALLDLCPTPLRSEARSWLRPDADGGGRGWLDWDGWIADYDERGRGWSSTEHRLFAVIASLVDPDRPLALTRTLGYLGSWEGDVWRILTEWGTGGNNRDCPGRMTVVPSDRATARR